MDIIDYIFIVQTLFLGAIFARMDGGGIVKTPEIVERLLVMSFFVFACWPSAGMYSVLALIGMVGIATGHGQYFLSMLVKAINPQRLDIIVEYFFGTDPRTLEKYDNYKEEKWVNVTPAVQEDLHNELEKYSYTKLYKRNLFGMFVTGSLEGLPAGIICLLSGNILGIVLLLTGFTKATSYFICNKLGFTTEPAEYIKGLLRNLLCLIALYGGLHG